MPETNPIDPVKISVVIRTYNRSRILRDAILSVLHQTTKAHEIIVVDDGSSDDTAAMVGDLILHNSLAGIAYHRHGSNRGPLEAFKTGITKASGDWIAFLDDDDIYRPEMLRVTSQAIAENPDYDMTYCDIWYPEAKTNECPFSNTSGGWDVLQRIFYAIIYPSTITIRASVAKELAPTFPPAPTAEEVGVYIRFFGSGHRAYAINQRLVERRETKGSLSSDNARHLVAFDRLISWFLQTYPEAPSHVREAAEIRRDRIAKHLRFLREGQPGLTIRTEPNPGGGLTIR